jgi:hypothetical protein
MHSIELFQTGHLKMSAGKLIEPKIITDLNQKVVCLLPMGFYFDDTRWEMIWDRYDKKGDTLTMADLKELFPDEKTVQNPTLDNAEKFKHK